MNFKTDSELEKSLLAIPDILPRILLEKWNA